MTPPPRTGHQERHHYSGPASVKFWHRVNSLTLSHAVHRRLYAMGVALQNKEERMLRELRKAEQKGTR